jgi:subtilisin-like proprotein convertase family protein
MATLPPATPTANVQNLSAMMGNFGGNTNASTNSAVMAIDPHNSSKVVAVWQVNDPLMAAATNNGEVVAVEAAYSVDGGQKWLPLFSEPRGINQLGLPGQTALLNPTTSGPTVPYAFQFDPKLGFDDNDQFYILTEYATALTTPASGALVLQRFDFSGDTPQKYLFNNNEQDPALYSGFPSTPPDLKVIYQWFNTANNDQALDPTLTVDSNQATLPPSVSSQIDPTSGNVYVSWTTLDVPVTGNPLDGLFNPYRILTTVSSDGGNNFGPPTVADVNSQNFNDTNGDPVLAGEAGPGNGPTTMRDFNPAITVSQGRLPSESGLSGDPGIPGGQVTVAWDNAATNTMEANTLTAGHDTSFGNQQGGAIPQNFNTTFSLPVNISNLTNLDSLDVRVDIIDPTDQFLGLVLIAPNNAGSYTLVDPGILTGANVGVQTYTNNNIGDYELGTIFDDNASRMIGVDKSQTAPYFGDYQPDGDFPGSTLADFVRGLGNNVNGTWKLETIGIDTSTTASPGFLLDWSLSFGRGLTPDNYVTVGASQGLMLPISATGLPTTTVPASPVPIGPGIVMAIDNTLGPDSPHEGRIYAAFVGHLPIPGNPATNTDIFVTYSDDAGRTWSAPIQVNSDTSTVDGFSQSNNPLVNNPNDSAVGRTQFQPAIAVDPVTGTVVVSWRDARNDPANTAVATYIATSIDGGKTWNQQQSYANTQETAVDAINPTVTDVIGPFVDNATTAANAANSAAGFGNSLGMAVYNGQLYPLWTGTLGNPGADGVTGLGLQTYYRPMVIAAGPRVVNSTQGPITYADAQSGAVTFDVYFDRPINPPDQNPSFTPADVQVFYHDTTNGDPMIPLNVTGVSPVAGSGVGPNDKFGYTEFQVTFDPSQQPGPGGGPGGPSGIADFTGTYSYLIAPDDGSNPIVAPVDSFTVTQIPQPQIGPVATSPNLPIPTSGTGGTGTSDDFTTSTIQISGHLNQVITGITVNLTLNHQNGSDLVVTLTAPDGQTATVPTNFPSGPINIVNEPYVVQGLTGGPVDSIVRNGVLNGYKLTIQDTKTNNVGTLTSWSVTIDSVLPVLGLQTGAPMDQNADGISDENPLTLPFGYTGTTPGDVYAVPTPQVTAPITFTSAQSILSPPFNQHTLPLIVPGPQVLSTLAVGTSGQLSTGATNLLTNDTASQFQVTFDRPIQTSTFGSGQVVSIMGPQGTISGPQSFGPSAINQAIPAATSLGSGTLSSPVSVSSGGTLKIQKLTVTINVGAASDAGLSAVLVAPDGTQVPLFSNLSGSNLVNMVLDDTSLNPLGAASAPYTGTFLPAYPAGAPKLSSLAGKTADGTWTLQLTNAATGVAATLDSWSLNITPVFTVTPVSPQTVTVRGVQEKVATTFAINFPQQGLSGTYTVQLGPNIQDEFGNQMDVSQSAGLNVLRGVDQNAPTATMRYAATGLPATIVPSTSTDTTGQPIPGTVSSSIVVPDRFVIAGDTTAAGQSVMQVQLDLAYLNDPDLTATLYHYSPTGTLLGQVVLFSDAGQGTTTANFSNTVFDDNAATPVQLGSAPFHAIYNPQQSLATVFAPAAGMNVQGTWTLVISNSSTTGTTGALNDWSLTFQKPLPTNGMGASGTNQPTTHFQLLNLGQSSSLSSQAWSPVGDASSTFETGQVTAIAVDPSDTTGNTVYVGGASGGVWKTTNFLTTSPNGPTWAPLTNFGPSAAINIGSISIFPRNHDPAQSIIVVGTGGASSGPQGASAPGVGFLVSMDGGVTWNVYDSTVNVAGTPTVTSGSGQVLPITSAARDRKFVGTIINQIAIDPQLSPTGQVIIYAAVSGPNGMGGIWESQNTGQSWTQVLNTGNATSVVLNRDSGIVLDPSTGTDVPGNLQIVYAGIFGQGVYMSANQGQSWNLMNGGIGNPLILNLPTGANVNPARPSPSNPNNSPGKIALSVPAPTGNAVQDAIYEGWLYAAVATQSGGFYGLYVTKDFGENWTQVQTPTLAPLGNYNQDVASNAIPGSANANGNVNYPITDNTQGNVNMTLGTDPTNPNILYLGGFGGDGYNSDTGLIRVDLTTMADSHALIPNIYYTTINPLQGTPAWDVVAGPPVRFTTNVPTSPVFPDPTAYLNFIRSPNQPFYNDDATLYVNAYTGFTNTGFGATFTPMDTPGGGQFIPPGSNTEISGTGYQVSLTEVDPATGLPRLIVGNLDGVYSSLDKNGQFQPFIGASTAEPSVNRNGNLQLGQIYYVAAQPSSVAAQAAQALFYAGAENIGGQSADPNLITDGNINWTALQAGGTVLNASGTAVDQQGSGNLFQFWSAGQGGQYTNFFKVNGVGRTFGLLQASGGIPTAPNILLPGNSFGNVDGQWPVTEIASIAVDPVNSNDLLVSSTTGNIFETTNQAVTWFQVGSPATFGSPGNTSLALAFGAPDPGAPEGLGNLGNFLYVGTAASKGQVFMSRDAGGTWSNISLGLDGSPVQQIITDPARGSHDAYAVTTTGVFYLKDSVLLSQNPTVAADGWVNITGGLKALAYSIFGQAYSPAADSNTQPYFLTTTLNSIAANWNYQIPNNPLDLTQGYHPVLYVAGNSGVFMSADNGLTWNLYPETTYGATVAGGYLPHVNVTSLSLSQGNVAVATGMPALAGPYQTFLFTGTLTSGSTTVVGITNTNGLAAGDIITGAGIPAGTTIASVNNAAHTLTLSANATASGTQSLSAANPSATPDPDLLLAGTYGEGAFAINMAPMLLTGTTQIAPADTGGALGDGTPIVTTAAPAIDGTSEITAFGNATWISIYDETPGDSTYGQVIGGFDPRQYALGKGITPTAANATDTRGNFAIPISAFTVNSVQFTGTLTAGSAVVTGLANVKGLVVGQGVTGTGIPAGATIKSINATADTITLSANATASGSQGLIAGLKVVKIVATDAAGSQSQPVTLSFVLNANDLSHPAPTSAPPAPFLELTPATPPYATINGIPVTNNTAPLLDGTADPGTAIRVQEIWTDAPGGRQTMNWFTLPASDITTVGSTESFSFAFQDFLDNQGNAVTNGTFSVVGEGV